MRIRPLSQYVVPLLLPSAILGFAGCGTKDDATGLEDVDPNIEFDMLAGVLFSEIAGVASDFMLPGGPPGCRTIAVAEEDGDSDGIPEEADVTYASSDCTYTFDGGSGTSSGSIHLIDSGESFGFAVTLSSMAYTQSREANDEDPAETRVRTLNGQRTVGGSPTRATMTQSIDITYTVTNKPSATATETWQAVFTAAQGNQMTLGWGERLPEGGTEVSGSFVWKQNGATVQLTLETVSPLRFPPTCESPFPSAGEVRARVVSGGPSGYVRLIWSSCGGEAQVDWVAG